MSQAPGPADAPTPRDLLASFDKAQRYCNLCPRLCHYSCPVSNAERDEAVTPEHKNALAGLVARGQRPLDEGAADLFYKCVSCGHCTEVCQHDNDVPQSLFSGRAMAVASGLEAPSVAELRASFERFGNAWLEDLSARLRDLVPEGLRFDGRLAKENAAGPAAIPGRGLRLYWPGCAALARQPDIVSTTLDVLERLGEPDVMVPCGDEAQCCGYPLLASGHHEEFVAQAKRASRVLRGAEAIFTAAPECAWTFSVAWPMHAGVPPPAKKIAHLVDLLLPALERAPARRPLGLDAVYHDPCYLGRTLGRYDEPRKIANSVLRSPMREVSGWNREEAYCCGAGGAFETTNPDSALSITRARLGHLLGATSGPPAEAGPENQKREAGPTIVTACPRCSSRFRDAGADCMDVVEVLARYLDSSKAGTSSGEPGEER